MTIKRVLIQTQGTCQDRTSDHYLKTDTCQQKTSCIIIKLKSAFLIILLKNTSNNPIFYLSHHRMATSPSSSQLKPQSQNESPSKQEPASAPGNPKNKKLFEQIWKTIFFTVLAGSSFFFKYVYEYQTLEEFAHIRKGNLFTLLAIGIPFAVVFIFADQLLHNVLDPLCDKYYISHVKYPDPQTRKKRCYSLVRWVFSLTYYTITAVSGYLILRPTSFMPTWLGGNGDCTDCIRYVRSFDQATLAMEVYYAVQFGKQFGRFFQHVFIRSEGSFYEFALHHLMTALLIFISYMMNFWLIGIFLLMIHDASDGLLLLPRAYKDCKVVYKWLLTVLSIVGSSMWIFCRIFMLSYCAVNTAVSNLIEVYTHPERLSGVNVEVLSTPAIFVAFMLCALLVQQFFWTYHIVSTFIEIAVSEKIVKQTYE